LPLTDSFTYLLTYLLYTKTRPRRLRKRFERDSRHKTELYVPDSGLLHLIRQGLVWTVLNATTYLMNECTNYHCV